MEVTGNVKARTERSKHDLSSATTGKMVLELAKGQVERTCSLAGMQDETTHIAPLSAHSVPCTPHIPVTARIQATENKNQASLDKPCSSFSFRS